MILNLIRKNYLLIIIIAAGAFLRVWGITYDLPVTSSVGDEVPLIGGALKMFNERSFIPHCDNETYFPLMYYIYFLAIGAYSIGLLIFTDISSIAGLKDYVILHYGDLFIIGRILTAVMGVAAIWLIYLIAKKLFRQRSVALIAALLFALSPFHVALSHFGKIWEPTVFFILLAFYFLLRLWHDPTSRLTRKKIVLTVVSILLPLSVNVVGILVYPLVLLIILIYYYRLSWRKFLAFLFSRWSAWLHGLLAGGVFIIMRLAPDAISFSRLWRKFFIADIDSIVAWGRNEIWEQPIWGKIGLAINFLWQFETIAFIFAVPAFIILYRKQRHNFYFLLFAFLLFYLPLNPPLLDSTRIRYMSVVVPFIILPASFVIREVVIYLKNKHILVSVFMLGLFITPSLFIDIKYDYLLHKNSTRLSVYSWIKDNLRPGENILLLGSHLNQELVPDKEIISLIRQYAPDYYSTRLQYLEDNILPDSDIRSYGIYSPGFVCQWPQEISKKIKYNYIAVTDESDKQRRTNIGFLHFCDRMPDVELKEEQLVYSEDTSPYYIYSIDSGNPIESYRPLWKIDKLGPKLNIYKLNE